MPLERLMVTIGPEDRDHADELTDVAIDLASAGATVYLLYVFPREEYDAMVDEDPGMSRIAPDELASRHESVESSSDRLDDAGIDHEIRGVVGGDLVEQTNEMLADLDVHHLVIGGRRRSPAGKAVFGDEAQALLLSAPCPVTYVGLD